MKRLVLSTGLFLLLGCATTPPQAPTNPSVVYLKAGDRVPASEPTTKWNPATLSIDIRSTQESKSLVATVNQEMSWDEQKPVYEDSTEYQEVQVPSSCHEFACDNSNGGGKSELWNQYYSAPASGKSKALSAAIYGVGQVSADALVARHYFASKPRSWDEFTAEIQRAANAGVIKQSVATNVIYNSAAENISALGYAQNSCHDTIRSCSMWVSKLVPVQKLTYQTVTQKKIINTKQFNVDIHVTGAKLLSTEKDHLDFSINENGLLIDTDGNGGLNRYNITSHLDGNHVAIDANQTQRILKKLSDNVIQQDSFILIGNTPTFVLDVDASYIPGSEDPQAQLVMDYMVQNCEYGWTGTCGFSSWKNLKQGSLQIKSARTSLAVTLPNHNKGQIVYSITRRNSAFFSNSPTSSRDTENVKMPR